jgi:ABC-type uncharacterized transport system ATPase subunit
LKYKKSPAFNHSIFDAVLIAYKGLIQHSMGSKRALIVERQPTHPRIGRRFHRIHPQRDHKNADCGVAVLLISAELDEIMALSDRIAVMYRDQIVAVVETKKTTREQLGL